MDEIDQALARIRLLLQRGADPIDDEHTVTQLRWMLTHMRRDGNLRDAPTREVFARLGDKWSPLLLLLLHMRTFRHATLWRLVGAVAGDGQISQRILRLRLRTLERDGLVVRLEVHTHPPGVYYELSAIGCELAEQIEGLMAWTRRHIDAMRQSQERYDRAHPVDAVKGAKQE